MPNLTNNRKGNPKCNLLERTMNEPLQKPCTSDCALEQLLEIANDPKYSDEEVGNAVRANLREIAADLNRLNTRQQDREMMTMNITYSIGTKFAAEGHVWTLVSCGNGRYGFTADDHRERPITFTMPCHELHAAVEKGEAVITERKAGRCQMKTTKKYSVTVRFAEETGQRPRTITVEATSPADARKRAKAIAPGAVGASCVGVLA